jgi:hypothetical protein
MQRDEWRHWTEQPSPFGAWEDAKGRDYSNRHLLPLRERFRFIDSDEEIVPGVTALSAAGLHPKIIGEAADQTNIAALKAGTQTAWTGFDPVYSTYQMMDAMLRDSQGMPIPQEQEATQPTQLLTKETVAGVTNWSEPKDALQQFKTLSLPAHELTTAYFGEIRRFIGMQQMTGNTDDIKLRTGIDVSKGKPQQQMPAGGMGGMIFTEVARNVTLRGLGELQTAKVMRAAESERQLNEVLVDFWSNHFNVDVKKDPIGSPLTFSMTRPRMRKPVLLYDQRERGSKSRGRVA